MTVNEKIALRIRELGTTQKAVAEASGLSTAFVSEICRGVKALGIESAKKLAPALNWPVSELIETEPDHLERWFWAARIGTLPETEFSHLKHGDPTIRVAWCLQQVQAAYPEINLPSIIGTSPEHVQRLAGGNGAITGQLLESITRALQLPPYWLALGEPGASDELVQRILQHRNAQPWLELVAEAMEHDLPPGAIRKLMHTFMEIADKK